MKAIVFMTRTCGPCKAFLPVVQEMIEDGAPIRIHMFGNDREQDQLQADKWSIRGVPTTVFTDEAEEIGFFQFPGRVPKDKFLSLFDIIEKELKNAGPDGPNDTGSQS